MKHPYLKSLNFRLLIWCLVLLGVVFVIHSCKKDNSKSPSTITNAAVSKAKAWYENTYPVNTNSGKLATQGVNSTYDYSQVIKPDWNNASTYSRLGKNVIEMPIDPSSAPIYSALSRGTTGIYPKENSRSSFILLSNGTSYDAYIMTILADPSYVKGDKSKLAKNTYQKHDTTFTGFVFYFTPKGQYSGGYEFKNGQLLTPATSSTQSNGKTIQSVGTSNLKTTVDEPTVDCTFYYELTLDDAGNITSQTFLYADCTPTPGGGSGSSGTGSTSGGAPSAPPPPVCNPAIGGSGDESVQSLIVNVAEPPGGGNVGMPPPSTEPCAVTVPTTENITNNLTDPCAHQVLDDLSNDDLTGQIANIIQNVFGSNVNVNLDFEESTTTQGNAPAASGPPTLTNGVFNDVITLNSTQTAGASREYLATLMIHEVLHAYISYNSTNQNSPQTQLSQHEAIAENYVTAFRDLLQQEFNIDNDSANALILEGESDLIGTPYYTSLLQSLNLTVGEVQTLSLLQKDGVEGTSCSN